MYRKFVSFITTLVCLYAFMPARVHASVKEDLQLKLSQIHTSKDSIPVLYDLFDLSDNDESVKYAMLLLDIGVREDDVSLILEASRHITFLSLQDDARLKKMLDIVRRLPDSEEKRMTETYISLRRVGYTARYASTEERMRQVKSAINDGYFNTSDNIYKRIGTLGSICFILGNSVQRGLITQYLDKTLQLVETLPDDAFSIKNLIYIYAATIYTNFEMPKEAVAANLRRLELLDKYAQTRHKLGRKYFNFNYAKALVYRLMLQNYKALTPEDADFYYKQINELAEINGDVKKLMESGVSHAFYLMAQHRYAEAIPWLRKVAEENPDRFIKKSVMRELMDAARETGDKETQLYAATRYAEALESYIKYDSDETYSELRVLFDVNDLEAKNAKLQLQKAEDSAAASRRMVRLLIIGAVILAVVLVLFIVLYRRAYLLSRKLADSRSMFIQENESLTKTRRELSESQKMTEVSERNRLALLNIISTELFTPADTIGEYVQLITDCSEADKKPYLQRYVDVVKLNTDILRKVVNDIIEVRDLNTGNTKMQFHHTSIKDICGSVIEKYADKTGRDVKLVFANSKDSDTIIVTDDVRVEQVLDNLLSNAVKFTDSGTITLAYDIDREKNNVTFTVTDSGIGVPPGKEEIIFNTFEKIDKRSQGSGLGLPICRMIAKLLHGEVYLDKEYTGQGSRFVFSIPLS